MKAFDRLYAKHPRKVFAGMIFLAAITLYAADRADRDNRVQWAANSRGAT